jgi:hypothetical protein
LTFLGCWVIEFYKAVDLWCEEGIPGARDLETDDKLVSGEIIADRIEELWDIKDARMGCCVGHK